jgi:hypothetical protein
MSATKTTTYLLIAIALGYSAITAQQATAPAKEESPQFVTPKGKIKPSDLNINNLKGELRTNEPPNLIFADKIHGVWMRIVRTNSKNADAEGYDPCYTSIVLMPTLRATGRMLPTGELEIQFRSEIAKGLPPAASGVQ